LLRVEIDRKLLGADEEAETGTEVVSLPRDMDALADELDDDTEVNKLSCAPLTVVLSAVLLLPASPPCA
jgi:hypothetical protein